MGDVLEAVNSIQTYSDAMIFWEKYVQSIMEDGKDKHEAEKVAKDNIGYGMGYYSAEDKHRVYELFSDYGVTHPIFGDDDPTMEEAFEAGQVLGEAWKRGKT